MGSATSVLQFTVRHAGLQHFPHIPYFLLKYCDATGHAVMRRSESHLATAGRNKLVTYADDLSNIRRPVFRRNEQRSDMITLCLHPATTR